MTTREDLVANAIRVLSMDAVQKANSGHPGMPMGMADIATVLWGRYLKADPSDPTWIDRDRVVVSNGHGSMLLYSALHLAGYDLSMDDIRNFRTWGSPTAGHPEVELHRGIEMTTGPLGQGFATAVGMAIAESHLRARFGSDLVDHWIYALVSDGDLMEGVSSEAASLAGHLSLGRLVYLYDDNDISLEGPTSWTFTEDTEARFRSYGWHTIAVDGHDHDAIDQAIAVSRTVEDQPSLLLCKTTIGYGSPNKGGKASSHGSPLGPDEVARVREALGWEHEPFEIPDEVYAYFSDLQERGASARAAWELRRDASVAADAATAAAWSAHFNPQPVNLSSPDNEVGASVGTRVLSGQVIQQLGGMRPDVLTGDADLAGSTKSLLTDADDFSATNRLGRNVRYGVREHAMGAAVNGATLHGGVRPFSSTFLQFADYMRPAMRLAALMGTPSVYVFTHDSVFLGEDGPTHQPIEHLAALRAIPNLWVVRPGDQAEAAGAWELAINRTSGPTALIFSRQGVPIVDDAAAPEMVSRGGYVVEEGTDVAIVATGSEVNVARSAAATLRESGLSVRVVSMPCVEAFHTQDDAYRTSVIGGGARLVSFEVGATYGWSDVVGSDSLKIGIDHFGASAPAAKLAEEYGFTADAVAARIQRWLAG